ncbi:MAG: caspase family protein [Bacteroidetes bacterium]|nr:MAG: caspase family protein [Bacteroidota bacterium]
MSKENRFAIIIGINDYESSPLNYCVNDAVQVKDILIQKARYYSENIFIITSRADDSIRDITGRYLEALRNIEKRFISKEDSILFYFAGHGKYFNNESQIKFHDSYYPISNVFNDIGNLEPRFQFYIIDACQSGGKVLSRQETTLEDDNLIQNFINKSSGVLFLYACQTNEQAQEESQKSHGIMTYHFLEALKNDNLYDTDSILTPGRIQEYVSKNTASESGFNQIPVIENRITGYYPFAFLSSDSLNRKDTEIIQANSIITNGNIGKYDQISRINIQDKIFEKINQKIADIKLNIDEYNIVEYNDFELLPFSNLPILVEKIVVDSRKLNLESINNIFITEQQRNYRKPQYNFMQPILVALGNIIEDPGPDFFIKYRIDYSNQYFKPYFRFYNSITIKFVSFCLAFYIYQAKWGLVLSCLTFMVDWDGEENSIIRSIDKIDYPLLIDNESLSKIDNLTLSIFNNISSKLVMWNKNRQEELSKFLSKE